MPTKLLLLDLNLSSATGDELKKSPPPPPHLPDTVGDEGEGGAFFTRHHWHCSVS